MIEQVYTRDNGIVTLAKLVVVVSEPNGGANTWTTRQVGYTFNLASPAWRPQLVAGLRTGEKIEQLWVQVNVEQTQAIYVESQRITQEKNLPVYLFKSIRCRWRQCAIAFGC